MVKPAVSILVPVCNTERFLRDCLNSLIAQTLTNIEIICIDDGSTDSSPAIIEDFISKDSRIKVITKPNSGYGDSMNKGLEEASGDYIGIVESDDFVEMEMFEELYKLGKTCDAEVVKGNFMYHKSFTDPHLDPVVDNLQNCPSGVPFDPLDHQDVFLTQPAIWSGIYKKAFLDQEKIRFLPTPGASFQDTGFNFKVFAAATRVILTEKAYLHYRIDNANSSVKSQKKIFCVCDEYDEIWRFAEEDQARYEALKYRIPQIEFGGYQWNLDRLIESLRHEFYDRFVADFSALGRKELLRDEYFDAIAWSKLTGMLSDPTGCFQAIYGPVDVDTTYLVRIDSVPSSQLEQSVDAILEMLGPKDELVFYLVNADERSDRHAQEVARRDGRLFYKSNLFVSPFLELVDASRLRGSHVAIVDLGLCTVEGSEASALGDVEVYDTRALLALDIPLLVPLMKAGYYRVALGQGTKDLKEPCKAYPRIQKGMIPFEEYVLAKDAFDLLSGTTQSLFVRDLGTVERLKIIDMFRPLWKSVQDAYYALTYDERIRTGSRPSSLSFPEVALVDTTNDDDVDVSVIVPVHNVERFLAECLESVLQQDADIEVICVDDGSTDGSLSMLQQFASRDERIRVFTQLNGGAGAARNRGIEHARGRYLAFVDPDDFYPSQSVLSRLLRAAEDSSALLCGGTLRVVNANGEPDVYIEASNSLYLFKGEGFCDLSIYENDYGWIRFLYSRLLFVDPTIRFPETYQYEDPVFFLKVAANAKRFYQVPDVVYDYRIEHKSPSWSAPKARDLLEGIQTNMKYAQEHDWNDLYSELVRRLDYDYYEAIVGNLDDEEVLARLIMIQAGLQFERINYVRDKGWKFSLLRALNPEPDLALTRLSKKIEKTRFYGGLQKARRKLRAILKSEA